MERVCVRVLKGFLANTPQKDHMATKFVEDGRTLYEVHYAGSRVALPAEDVVEHERYFLVYVKAQATQDNPRFAGEVRKYLYGKGDELIFTDSKEITAYTARYDKLWANDIREYGYKRRQDAKRCYSYKHTENGKYWISKSFVVEYDVCGSEVTEL